MIQGVAIETLPARRVAAIRHVGPYMGIGAAFEKLARWAAPRGLLGPGVLCLGVYHDDPRSTPPDQLRSDACITVEPGVAADAAAGVQILDLAPGRYIVALHKGHYSGLPQSYLHLITQWMPAHGCQPDARPCYELYLNDPQSTPPDELLTEIHLPVR
jgi:AraC family transcriptional regulator